MAQKVTVALEDDLDGGPADETVRFAIDGTDYEIDLRASHADAFRKQLAPYIEHARRARRSQPRRPGVLRPAGTTPVTSGPGRKTAASSSVSAAASRPAWQSSTAPRTTGADYTTAAAPGARLVQVRCRRSPSGHAALRQQAGTCPHGRGSWPRHACRHWVNPRQKHPANGARAAAGHRPVGQMRMLCAAAAAKQSGADGDGPGT
jgi:hypothetical protein